MKTKIFYSLIFILFVCHFGFGQANFTSKAGGGNWNTASTWTFTGTDGDGIPDSDDHVLINQAGIVVTGNATCSSMTWADNDGSVAASLEVQTGITLTVTSSIIYTFSDNHARLFALKGAGTLNCNSFTIGNSTLPNTNDTTRDHKLTSTIANFNIATNLTLISNTGATNRFNNAFFSHEAGTVTCGNIIFTGTSSSKLTVDGTLTTGAITMSSSLSSSTTSTISGTGTINCTSLTVGTNSLVPTSTNETKVSSSITTFNISGNLNIISSLNGSFTNDATFSYGGGTLNLSGRITTTGNGTTASPTSTFITTAAGNINLSYGNDAVPLETPLNAGGNVKSVIVFNVGSPTVNYNRTSGTGNQAIIKPLIGGIGTSTNYNNLGLNGIGIKYFPAIQIYVNNRLVISTGVKADLNTFNSHSVRHLTLDPYSETPAGTYGGTTSGATYTNTTFFTTKVGLLTRRDEGCTVPTSQTVTGTGSSNCSNTTIPSSTIGLGVSQINVTYQLLRGITVVETKESKGTGGITFAAVNTPGVYTVIARATSTYCPQTIVTMTGSVSITVKPNAPSANLTPTSTLCGSKNGAISALNSIPLNFANGNYVQLTTTSGTPLLNNLTQFTVEGWIKFAPGSINPIGNYSFFGQDGVVELGIVDNNIRIFTRKDVGQVFDILDFPLSSYPNDGNWHHLAATGKVNDKLTLYVDGYAVMSVNSNPVSGNYGTANTAHARIGAGVIATMPVSPNPVTDGLTGSAFKIGFWNTQLSAAQITTLAASFKNYNNDSGLLAGYNFYNNGSTSLSSTGSIANTPVFYNNTSVLNGAGIPVYVDPYSYAWTGPAGFTPPANPQPKTISGLAPGTYSLTTTLDGCSATVNNVAVAYNIAGTQTWGGSAWTGTNGSNPPTLAYDVVFAGNYNSNLDVNACNCTVNTTRNVTIQTGKTLTVVDKVTVAGTGTLTFEDKSSLVQTLNVTTNANSGNIIYKRISPSVRRLDYTYWASPVAGMTMAALSPNTSPGKYMSYNDDAWVISFGGGATMQPGVGYSICGPLTHSETVASSFTGTFTGKPNNGTMVIPTVGTWHLVGNPYPSALYADKLLTENSHMYGTIYFWTHYTSPSTGNTEEGDTETVNYSSDDYASYNLTGGIGFGDDADSGSSVVPSGYIGAGQSFFMAEADSVDSSVTFTNEMRYGGINNDQFFKTTLKAKTKNEKERIWLNLTNDKGLFKQILIGYVPGATNDFDRLYDGVSFNYNPFADFYSIYNGSTLSIQGREQPFINTDEVPLGFMANLGTTPAVASTFSIEIDHTDDNFNNQPIYLYDKVTNTNFDLRKSKYTFTSGDGIFNDRFVLKYTDNTLGVDDLEDVSKGLTVVAKNKIITIESKTEKIKKVTLFEITGKTIYNKDQIGNSIIEITSIKAKGQVLLVKVLLENGTVETRKLILN